MNEVSPLIGEETDFSQSKSLFLDCLHLIERLHRRMLDVLRDRLEASGRMDINAVQALLLYNIGENELTAGELRTRGYYLGSNVTYNLKKLVEMGLVSHERSAHDKRAVRIALTESGREVRQFIDKLYDEQLSELLDDTRFGIERFRELRRSLKGLERYWAEQLRFI